MSAGQGSPDPDRAIAFGKLIAERVNITGTFWLSRCAHGLMTLFFGFDEP